MKRVRLAHPTLHRQWRQFHADPPLPPPPLPPTVVDALRRPVEDHPMFHDIPQRSSTYLHVNLGYLKENLARIETLAGGAKVLPMVKGNAYGNGLVPVARYLTEELNYRTLGVAALGEALQLYHALPKQFAVLKGGKDTKKLVGKNAKKKSKGEEEQTHTRVVIFSDTEIHNPHHRKHYFGRAHFPFIPVLQSPRDVQCFLCEPRFRHNTELWLKVNTGMNRLGCSLTELEKEVIPLLKKAKAEDQEAIERAASGSASRKGTHIAVSGRGKPKSTSVSDHSDVVPSTPLRVQCLMTHFSNADVVMQPGDSTSRQLEQFELACSLMASHEIDVVETSCSNSGGILQGIHVGNPNRWVRPGLMMYGPCPLFETQSGKPLWDGKQVNCFVTKVLETRWFKKGDPIGYGYSPLPEDSLVVTLPIGYADGFVRYYTGSTVFINGIKGKVHGRVNMDLTFVVFSGEDLAAAQSAAMLPKPEQPVVIWDHDNRSIERLSREVGTNTYSLMCCLTNRVPRYYSTTE